MLHGHALRQAQPPPPIRGQASPQSLSPSPRSPELKQEQGNVGEQVVLPYEVPLNVAPQARRSPSQLCIGNDKGYVGAVRRSQSSSSSSPSRVGTKVPLFVHRDPEKQQPAEGRHKVFRLPRPEQSSNRCEIVTLQHVPRSRSFSPNTTQRPGDGDALVADCGSAVCLAAIPALSMQRTPIAPPGSRASPCRFRLGKAQPVQRSASDARVTDTLAKARRVQRSASDARKADASLRFSARHRMPSNDRPSTDRSHLCSWPVEPCANSGQPAQDFQGPPRQYAGTFTPRPPCDSLTRVQSAHVLPAPKLSQAGGASFSRVSSMHSLTQPSGRDTPKVLMPPPRVNRQHAQQRSVSPHPLSGVAVKPPIPHPQACRCTTPRPQQKMQFQQPCVFDVANERWHFHVEKKVAAKSRVRFQLEQSRESGVSAVSNVSGLNEPDRISIMRSAVSGLAWDEESEDNDQASWRDRRDYIRAIGGDALRGLGVPQDWVRSSGMF